MHKNQRGIALPIIIFGVLILCAVVGIGWLIRNHGTGGLVEKSYCSDVCPQQTRKFKIYRNIKNQQQCDKIGGQTVKDAGFGGYIGCRPRASGQPAEVRG